MNKPLLNVEDGENIFAIFGRGKKAMIRHSRENKDYDYERKLKKYLYEAENSGGYQNALKVTEKYFEVIYI